MTPTDLRVAYDSQIFVEQEFGGISRYFASLANELHGMAGVEARIIAPLYINAYLDRLRQGVVLGYKVRRLPKTSALIRAANRVLTLPASYSFRPDIVHETYYPPQPSPPRRALHVVTVFDMIHEKFPHDFPASDPIAMWKRSAVLRADHVICISEQTRRDLLQIHPVKESKVSVTYLNCDALTLPDVGGSEEFRCRVLGADVPYLLYVGRRGGYKNFSNLLKAYADSPWLRQNFHLLCAGGGGWRPEERAQLSALGLLDKVVQVGGGDDVLAMCYRHASIFVFPSMYEGFGIPPLEAMSLDCPVACSNTSSIPEVVGDAAEYFDPADIGAMRTAIEKVLQSETLRNELVIRGQRRRQNFSWLRCARETLAIYRTVLR